MRPPIGRITMDRLQEKGYPKDYACALVASGACTGILIPPSIAYIIIGLVLGHVLGHAVPGRLRSRACMILLRVMITNAIVNRVQRLREVGQPFSFGAGSRR